MVERMRERWNGGGRQQKVAVMSPRLPAAKPRNVCASLVPYSQIEVLRNG